MKACGRKEVAAFAACLRKALLQKEPNSMSSPLLLLGILLSIAGLAFLGVWSNVLGHSATLFPMGSDGTPESKAFLMGRSIIAVVLLMVARWIRVHWGWITGIAALVMCFATGFTLMAPFQSLMNPKALSFISTMITSMCYVLMVTPFYVYMAEQFSIRSSAFAIMISLVLELWLTNMLCASLSSSHQMRMLMGIPLATGLMFLGTKRIAELARSQGEYIESNEGEPYSKNERSYLFIRLFIFTVTLACVRSLSQVGIWGYERGGFWGSGEISLELVPTTVFLVLTSVGIYVIPYGISNAIRSVMGLVVVLAGFSLIAFMGDSQEKSYEWVIGACELFAHLQIWVNLIECTQHAGMPCYRVAGLQCLVYVVSTEAMRFCVESPETSVETVVVAVLYILFVVMLTPLVIWGQQKRGNAILEDGSPQNEAALESATISNESIEEFARVNGLSPRESQVFRHLLLGAPYSYIQKACNISNGTVRTHVNKIYKKLNVHSRGELFEFFQDYASGNSSGGGSE